MSTSDFGPVLKGWRERLSPVDAGLSSGSRRRTSGLRREELAQLSGVSVDYLVRLEQSRARSPSPQVTAALARALQLDRSERDHLFRCAGLLPPSEGWVDTHVPPGIARMVTRLGDTPIAVFAADWHLLMWNPMWSALLGDPTVIAYERRNLVRALFDGDEHIRRALPVSASPNGSAHLVTALVADLRSSAVKYPDDASLTTLITDLRSRHSYFDYLWTSGKVAAHASERKTVAHPVIGDVTLDCDVLTAPGSDLRLVVYTAAAGSRDADALALLRVTRGNAPMT